MKEKCKKRFFLFAAPLVFALSLFGAYLFKGEDATPHPATLEIRYRHCDNALAAEIPQSAFDATLGSTPCRVLAVRKEPTRCAEQKNGSLLYYDSLLFSDVIFTVSAEVTLREEMAYASDDFLSPGKRVTLCSPVFYGECDIISLKVG